MQDLYPYFFLLGAAAVIGLGAGIRQLRSRVDRLQQQVSDLGRRLDAGASGAASSPVLAGGGDYGAGPEPVAASHATTSGIAPELVDELRHDIRAGRKIEAIRRVREITGMSLTDAKNYVETL